MTTVYDDDPDASWTFTVTDNDGANLDWANPLVAAADADYLLAATWLDVPAPVRKIKVPLDTLPVGSHRLYLQVPSGNDIPLGQVYVAART